MVAAVLQISLRDVAATFRRNRRAKGVIVISVDDDGTTSIGVSELTPKEARDALCAGLHMTFVQEDRER